MTVNKVSEDGFTLIELLIVILIISILAVTVFVALNPIKRFGDARDSRRWTDVDSVLNAVLQYKVDNNGQSPAGMMSAEQQLGTDGTGCSVANNCNLAPTEVGCLNLAAALSPYLKSIPVDPRQGTSEKTGYKISEDTNGIVTVTACITESVNEIAVSR